MKVFYFYRQFYIVYFKKKKSSLWMTFVSSKYGLSNKT